ncbi:winged helix-turn-helix domain-containing protein [Enterobacter asburiae]|uniref:winged helix-turn-helix domain-containing protein n=1 Tax=Scandinavium sp. UTDF21-P1B TaxID=3446379 RepID=UPI0034925BBA
MLNNIAIGSSVTLDLHTRTLTRTLDGESVTLPASACLCLQALVDAHGEVLSQEQLMDIGWRSAGVEVTENSVRVMINKLRRALNSLGLQDSVTLLAVTRSGYRLIVRDDGTAELTGPLTDASPPSPSPLHPQSAPPASQPVRRPPPPVKRSNPRKYLITGLCGILAGLGVAILLHYLFIVTPERINFVRWDGPGVPANTQVMVPRGKENQLELIEATLRAYTQHSLIKRTDENPPQVLYVTLGDPRIKKHLGLIACEQPFQDSNNDCESFYFRFD